MEKGDFTHCKTLPEFYDEITEFLKGAHGKNYVANHAALNRCIDDVGKGCVVKEIGVNQGSSLAAMVLNPNTSRSMGIDILPKNIAPYHRLFDEYCKSVGSTWALYGGDSLKTPAIDVPCDVLHIDGQHRFDYVYNELTIYSKNVSSYMVLHDTAHPKNPGVFKALNRFLEEDRDFVWVVHEDCTEYPGHTVLRRNQK